jgi:phosphoribosylglycinamide formyltransferase-1
MTDPCRVTVLASGGGTNLQALLDRQYQGRLGARVTTVLSDQPGAGALDRARRAGVSARSLEPADYPDREAYDRALSEAVTDSEPHLVVLAGFMRILGPPFVERFAGRTLNIHPSLLPAFRGLHTHRKALEAGCRLHGTTVHFVTADLDAGPIVAQAAVRVHDDDTPESLRDRVQAREHRLLPRAVRWFAEGRLVVTGNRVTLVRQGEPATSPAASYLEDPPAEAGSEAGDPDL